MKILLAHDQERLKEKLINIHKELARDYLFHNNLDFNTFKIIEDALLAIEIMILSLADASEILDSKENYYKRLINRLQEYNKNESKG
ncbi:hypothetical protein [Thomasclavelia spiroformis]|jgi:hypothetical protein|uniref:Uncharacterized protein n=1 Tax=Myoviridae sp. ct1AP5 TaxID=2825017 RepID=A0A8S5UDY7_9CAUD|nr:hypothetical protein [Thomasclavelia spiroformis]DAF92701.1 MAG TPA: hypothetical protein [Myoviridae sp. ct1AP5]